MAHLDDVSVTVRIRAPRKIHFELLNDGGIDHFRAYIDLSLASILYAEFAGDSINTDINIDYPDKYRDPNITISGPNPISANLHIDYIITREVPVNENVNLHLPEGFARVNTITNPATVVRPGMARTAARNGYSRTPIC
jgi:hypothetical protein